MSLYDIMYNANITFLHRPARSVLSSGSEELRAIPWNFANVDELSDFVKRLLYWEPNVASLYAQTIASCCFHIILFIVIGIFMVKRLRQGKLRFYRVVRRSSGDVVVPNPLMSFLSMAMLFEVFFVPFLLYAGHKFDKHTGPPQNIVIWFTLPWLALAIGMIAAIIGTHLATSESKSSTASSASNGFFGQAKVITLLSILSPMALTLIIFVSSVVCNQYWRKAMEMEKSWQLKYASLPSFTNEMVQESQLVWYQTLKAAHLASVLFIIWAVIAFTLSAIFCFVSLRLIKAIRQELVKAQSASKATSLNDKKNLESALLHTYIQMAAIAPAAASFGAISLALGFTLYGKLEHHCPDGGNRFEECISPICIAMIYVSCMAGALQLLSVVYKTYEDPILSSPIMNKQQQQQEQEQFDETVSFEETAKTGYFSS